MTGRLGVCSWSLQVSSVGELVEKVCGIGLSAIQLALDPLRRGEMPVDDVRHALSDAGIEILSGMMAMQGEDYSTLESIRRTGGVVPDATWDANLAAARENATIASSLGISLVTFHAGFIPHDDTDGTRSVLVARLRELANVYGAEGVRVGLETGQEGWPELLSVLEACEGAGASGVGVNFDPANMILYGMGDPVEAIRALRDRVVQVHIKDALPTETPGQWGTEVPVGRGAVPWEAFFEVVRELDVDLAIEREAGGSRLDDVRAAAALVKRLRG